jgi:pimeloyl-ACP methyl ester carboxylesterase
VAPGVQLHLERRAGRGRALLLAHGLASNLRLWDGVGARLCAAGHSVVAVDQRGHGQSDAPDTPYGLDTAVEDLRQVICRLPLERPILVGQSWGGNVALELAWRWPAGIGGVVCVDGGIIELADRYPSWEACLRALAPPPLAGLHVDDLSARIRAGYAGFPPGAVEAALANFRVHADRTVEPRLTRVRHLEILASLWRHRPSTRYPELRVPLLLLLADTGDGGVTAAKRHAEARALALAPRVRSHWFSPAHHDVHLQYPDRVAEVLLDAVRSGFFP